MAVRNLESAGVDPYFGASQSDLLVNDLAAGDGVPCKLHVVEWKGRAEFWRWVKAYMAGVKCNCNACCKLLLSLYESLRLDRLKQQKIDSALFINYNPGE